MTVQRTGIPTTFQHQNFRSRLEARWAAFFDLIEWPWIYEPYDLEGYIPDFLVTGKAPFLVEVKPAVSVEELVEKVVPDLERRGIHEQLAPDLETEETDLLIVGVSPTIEIRVFDWPQHLVLGLSFLSSWGTNDRAIWDSTNPFVWVEENGSWMHRPAGIQNGNSHLRYNADSNLIEQLWREAGNRVQWHKR